MGKSSFEYWRHLWDDKRTDMAVIFAGGDSSGNRCSPHGSSSGRNSNASHPTRSSPPCRPSTPIWAAVDPDIIKDIDRKATHGSFRNWANFTKHVLNGMKKMNLTEVNMDLVQWVYSKLGGM
jgi:hypothetical protein